jgi:hypothetical protein
MEWFTINFLQSLNFESKELFLERQQNIIKNVT